MSVSLHSLLGSKSLALTSLVSTAADGSPIDWVYSSDLADPTPFLGAGQMVLTTGSQFLDARGAERDDRVSEDPAPYERYVARLGAAGIRVLGFGTDVVRTGTPAPLVAACARQGVSLVEVPYRIPFIAIIRFVADALAREANARDAWAFRAQRAVSLAALGADGVSDSLRTLSHQLDRTVVLFDAAGAVTSTIAPGNLADAAVDEIAAEAMRMLRRGTRASSELVVAGLIANLQTFGRRGDLGGVLAVAGPAPLDAAETSVVTAAVALTEVSLGQGRDLRQGMDVLRTQALGLLADGYVERARAVLEAIGERLPAEPVVVLVVAAGDESLSRRALAAGRLHARWRGGLAIVMPAEHAADAPQWCAEFEVAGGLSAPVDYAGLAGALDAAAAASALSVAGECRPAREAGSILGLMAEEAARRLAAGALAPVLERSDSAELLDGVAAWLRHNGQWDPAARELGIHRHSLKARVERVAALLDLDLDLFESRVTLWALIGSAPARA